MKDPPAPWVIIGRIGRAIGLDGSVRVWPEGDLEAILDKRVPIGAWNPEKEEVATLAATSAREDGHGWVVHWSGIDERASTVPLRNAFVVAQRKDLPEPLEGFVYRADLIGAIAETREEGHRLGEVIGVLDTPAHLILEILSTEGSSFLLPLSEEVDAKFEDGGDADERARLLVNLPDGMEEATANDYKEIGKARQKTLAKRISRGEGPADDAH